MFVFGQGQSTLFHGDTPTSSALRADLQANIKRLETEAAWRNAEHSKEVTKLQKENKFLHGLATRNLREHQPGESRTVQSSSEKGTQSIPPAQLAQKPSAQPVSHPAHSLANACDTTTATMSGSGLSPRTANASDLQAKLQEAEDDLSHEKAKRTRDLKDFSEKHKKLLVEIAQQKRRAETHDQSAYIATIEEKMDQLKTENKEREEKSRDQANNIANLKKEYTKLEEEISTSRDEAKMLYTELNSKTTQLDELRTKTNLNEAAHSREEAQLREKFEGEQKKHLATIETLRTYRAVTEPKLKMLDIVQAEKEEIQIKVADLEKRLATEPVGAVFSFKGELHNMRAELPRFNFDPNILRAEKGKSKSKKLSEGSISGEDSSDENDDGKKSRQTLQDDRESKKSKASRSSRTFDSGPTKQERPQKSLAEEIDRNEFEDDDYEEEEESEHVIQQPSKRSSVLSKIPSLASSPSRPSTPEIPSPIISPIISSTIPPSQLPDSPETIVHFTATSPVLSSRGSGTCNHNPFECWGTVEHNVAALVAYTINPAYVQVASLLPPGIIFSSSNHVPPRHLPGSDGVSNQATSRPPSPKIQSPNASPEKKKGNRSSSASAQVPAPLPSQAIHGSKGWRYLFGHRTLTSPPAEAETEAETASRPSSNQEKGADPASVESGLQDLPVDISENMMAIIDNGSESESSYSQSSKARNEPPIELGETIPLNLSEEDSREQIPLAPETPVLSIQLPTPPDSISSSTSVQTANKNFRPYLLEILTTPSPDPRFKPPVNSTLIAFAIHLIFYYFLFILYSTVRERSIWLEANNVSRSIVADMFDRRHGYSRGLTAEFFSEGVASTIDKTLIRIAKALWFEYENYPMPG